MRDRERTMIDGLGRLAPVAAVVVLGSLMSILDTTIVSVAIATLAREFDAPLATIQWVVTAYLLALVSAVPLAGWAAGRIGTSLQYRLSIALFIVGSALSGLAWSAGALIAFRVLQGLGGGMILTVGATILNRAGGRGRVARTLGGIGVAAMFAPLLGPLLGGLIVEGLSWRWIFFLDVPAGALALALAVRVLPADRSRRSGRRRRPLGSGLLADLRLFRGRGVVAASGVSLILGAEFFGTLLLLPLYFQAVRGDSPVLAGLLLVPRGVGAAVAVAIGGRIVDRFGAGRAVLAGLATTAVAVVPWTQVGASTSHWLLGGSQLVQGLGVGLSATAAVAGAYQALARAALPRATSVLGSIQRIGGSIGTVLLALVLQQQIAAAAAGAGAIALQRAPTAAGADLAPRLATAFGNTFWWALGLTLLAALPALLLIRSESEPSGRADGDEPAGGGVGLALPRGSGAPAARLGRMGMARTTRAGDSRRRQGDSDSRAGAARKEVSR